LTTLGLSGYAITRASAQPFGKVDEEAVEPGPAVPTGTSRKQHFERVDRAVKEGAAQIRLEEAQRMAPFDLQWGLP